MDIFRQTPAFFLLAPRIALVCLMGFAVGICETERVFGQPSDEEIAMMEAEQEAQQGREGSSHGPPSSRRGGTSQANPRDVYLAPLKSITSGIDLMPALMTQLEVQVQSGPLLDGEAKGLFQAGYQTLANELMYGHMVAEYQDAQKNLTSVQYSPMFKRPTWSIRCGLSMAVRGDDSVTDFHPIGESANRSAGGAPREMQSEMQREMEISPSGEPEDFGREQEEQEMSARGEGFPGRSRRPARSHAPTGMAPPGMLSETVQKELQNHVGLVATILSEEFDKRWKARHFGAMFSGVTAPPPQSKKHGRNRLGATTANASMMISGPLANLVSEAPDPTPMFRPGLVYLGMGASDEMLLSAMDNDIDLLIHLDVIIKESKGGNMNRNSRKQTVQNVSRVRVLNVHTKKSLVSSRGIDNQAVQKTTRPSGSTKKGSKSSRDYIREQMVSVFRLLDGAAKTTKLPKLTPEVAKRRVATLLSGSSEKPLRKMAEIRLYESMGLVNSEDVDSAFYILDSHEGLILLHGPLSERREVARKLAMKAVEPPPE